LGEHIPAGGVVVDLFHLNRGTLIKEVLQGVSPSVGLQGHAVRLAGSAVARAMVRKEAVGFPGESRRARERGWARARALADADRGEDVSWSGGALLWCTGWCPRGEGRGEGVVVVARFGVVVSAVVPTRVAEYQRPGGTDAAGKGVVGKGEG
jgi:hypothetical protein